MVHPMDRQDRQAGQAGRTGRQDRLVGGCARACVFVDLIEHTRRGASKRPRLGTRGNKLHGGILSGKCSEYVHVGVGVGVGLAANSPKTLLPPHAPAA